MVCPRCGATIAAASSRCPRCTADLESPVTTGPTAPPAATGRESMSAPGGASRASRAKGAPPARDDDAFTRFAGAVRPEDDAATSFIAANDDGATSFRAPETDAATPFIPPNDEGATSFRAPDTDALTSFIPPRSDAVETSVREARESGPPGHAISGPLDAGQSFGRATTSSGCSASAAWAPCIRRGTRSSASPSRSR